MHSRNVYKKCSIREVPARNTNTGKRLCSLTDKGFSRGEPLDKKGKTHGKICGRRRHSIHPRIAEIAEIGVGLEFTVPCYRREHLRRVLHARTKKSGHLHTDHRDWTLDVPRNRSLNRQNIPDKVLAKRGESFIRPGK